MGILIRNITQIHNSESHSEEQTHYTSELVYKIISFEITIMVVIP